MSDAVHEMVLCAATAGLTCRLCLKERNLATHVVGLSQDSGFVSDLFVVDPLANVIMVCSLWLLVGPFSGLWLHSSGDSMPSVHAHLARLDTLARPP